MSTPADNLPFTLSHLYTDFCEKVESRYIGDKPDQMHYSVRFSFEADHRMVASTLEVSFARTAKPYLMLAVSCHFNIQAAYWKKKMLRSDRSITIPRTVAIHMLILTAGATRGIIHAHAQGTKWHHLLLPTIDLNDVIKKDIHIPISHERMSHT